MVNACYMYPLETPTSLRVPEQCTALRATLIFYVFIETNTSVSCECRLVVITCMDSRLIPEEFLGLGIGDAEVMRGGGAKQCDPSFTNFPHPNAQTFVCAYSALLTTPIAWGLLLCLLITVERCKTRLMQSPCP